MASLADIPQELMNKQKAIPFMEWLFRYDLPAHTRREITQTWALHTGADPKTVFAILETRLGTRADGR